MLGSNTVEKRWGEVVFLLNMYCRDEQELLGFLYCRNYFMSLESCCGHQLGGIDSMATSQDTLDSLPRELVRKDLL